MSYKAEYIWIDGTRADAPSCGRRPRSSPTAQEPPIWGFDGSSTKQATGRRLGLRPQAGLRRAPIRSAAATTSWCMCEVFSSDGKPHPSQHARRAARGRREVRSPRPLVRHRAGVHLLRRHQAARLARQRLPRPAGRLLLRRRRRRGLRPPGRRGAPGELPEGRPQDLRHQRRGHARSVGVPGRPGRARSTSPTSCGSRAGCSTAPPRTLGIARASSTPSRSRATGTARLPHQLLDQGDARELRRRASPPPRRWARAGTTCTSPTTASASRSA